MNPRLCRSRTNRMIGGVCGGLGEYFQVDPTIIRLMFVLLALADGPGILIYLVLWLVLPDSAASGVGTAVTVRTGAQEIANHVRGVGGDLRTTRIAAAILIVLGTIFFAQEVAFLPAHWSVWDMLLPLMLIVGGIALLQRRIQQA